MSTYPRSPLDERIASHETRCRLASAAYEMWELRITPSTVRRTIASIRRLVERYVSNPPVSTHLADGEFVMTAEAMSSIIARCDALLASEGDLSKSQ